MDLAIYRLHQIRLNSKAILYLQKVYLNMEILKKRIEFNFPIGAEKMQRANTRTAIQHLQVRKCSYPSARLKADSTSSKARECRVLKAEDRTRRSHY